MRVVVVDICVLVSLGCHYGVEICCLVFLLCSVVFWSCLLPSLLPFLALFCFPLPG